MIQCNCSFCGKEMERFLSKLIDFETKKPKKIIFCSKKCYLDYYKKYHSRIDKCSHCGKEVRRTAFIGKECKSNRIFCNSSCSASYNNKFKKKNRRSKVEILLFNLLKENYPNLEILNNDKTILDGYEVDIYIPLLKLAIEWNGIIHFKPIYGEEKFKRRQEIDQKKLELATRKDINLIVISDITSTKKYVYEAFEKIKIIIDELITKI